MYKLKTLIFPVGLLAVAIFMHVYYKETSTELLYLVPGLVGIGILLANNEEPAPPGKFWFATALSVISVALCGIVGASRMFG